MSDFSRLSALLSFLAANRGVTVRDAARASGMEPAQILEHLETLSMCGVPPYSPHDYVSYRLSGRGDDATIELLFARHFARPLNFTPPEALALKFALDHFARGADPESAAQLAELEAVLGNTLHGRVSKILEGPARGFVVPRQTDRVRRLLGTLAEAVDGRWVTQLEYYSSHRAKLGKRKVHPFEVLEIGTHFYLFAYCELAGATRHFRVDRIRAVDLTDEQFARRSPAARKPGRMAPMFEGRPRDRLVVRFSKRVAREVADEWRDSPGVKLTEARDGGLTIESPLYNQFWAIGFVAGFGADAKVLRPAWLKDEISLTVRAIVAAHR